jgi:hypothetical protein
MSFEGGGIINGMHRPTVGVIALVLLLAAAASLLLANDQADAWRAGFLRVGLLMGALWLAMPHLQRVRPFWVLSGLVVGVVVLIIAAKHPFQMALLAVIALVLGYLSTTSRARRAR